MSSNRRSVIRSTTVDASTSSNGSRVRHQSAAVCASRHDHRGVLRQRVRADLLCNGEGGAPRLSPCAGCGRGIDKAWLAIGLIPLSARVDRPHGGNSGRALSHCGSIRAHRQCSSPARCWQWPGCSATGAEAVPEPGVHGARVAHDPARRAGRRAGTVLLVRGDPVHLRPVLAVGAPLSAVMAFWLASPLMDPAMFLITAGTLGTGFADGEDSGGGGPRPGRRVAGKGVRRQRPVCRPAEGRSAVQPEIAHPPAGPHAIVDRHRRPSAVGVLAVRRSACGHSGTPRQGTRCSWPSGCLLAYLVQAVMLEYLPAELIGSVLGGDGLRPIVLGAVVGAPAYLNGFATVPLVDALLAQGMSNGAAMSLRHRRRRELHTGGDRGLGPGQADACSPPTSASRFAGSILAGLTWNAIA